MVSCDSTKMDPGYKESRGKWWESFVSPDEGDGYRDGITCSGPEVTSFYSYKMLSLLTIMKNGSW